MKKKTTILKPNKIYSKSGGTNLMLRLPDEMLQSLQIAAFKLSSPAKRYTPQDVIRILVSENLANLTV